MSVDPERWKDSEAPAELRALLENARRIPPMPAAVRAALLEALPPVAPPPVHPPAPVSLLGSAVGTPIAWIAAALVIVIAAALFWSARPGPAPDRAPPPGTAEIADAPPVAAPPSGLPPVLEAAPAPTVVESPPVPRVLLAPPAPSAARPRASGSSAPAPVGDTLAEESALIGRARASLATDPGVTLVAVEEHARRFPRGELAPEREYLRINSLRRLGRNGEARTRAQTYLVTYASSPYVPAVRKILTELGPP